eukprot:13708631-Alexandrium_andersonii.AAC.1
MWRRQRRHLSYAALYLPRPVQDNRCLPQGDAWAPMCLSATLAPVIRRIAQQSGSSLHQMNFLDDRTVARATWEDVQKACGEWEAFESASGIPGNPAKTQ